MRLEQLRVLSAELDLVRPPGGGGGDESERYRAGRERQIHLQESDRLLLLQGIRDTAVTLAKVAAPVEAARLDPASAARMRRIAKKVVAGETLVEDESKLWQAKRPHAMMRLKGVKRLKGEIEALERRVHELRIPDEDAMVHPALVDPGPEGGEWTTEAAAVPFGGFELLRERRSEAAFKGESMQASNQMFVDFSTSTPHVQRWQEASAVIINCASSCAKLLARTASCSPSLVYHQVLALVEHTFLTVLPVPNRKQVSRQMRSRYKEWKEKQAAKGAEPSTNASAAAAVDGGEGDEEDEFEGEEDEFEAALNAELDDEGEEGVEGGGGGGGGGGSGGGGGASVGGGEAEGGATADAAAANPQGGKAEGADEQEGPYTPKEAHVRVQRDCLQALNDVLLLYAAAAKTMWRQDDAEAEVLRAVTSGCIFAVFDAVLRISALPAPLHLSEVMTGRSGLPPSIAKLSGADPLAHTCHYSTGLKDFRKETLFQTAVRGSVLASYPGMLTTRCRLLEYLDWLNSDHLLALTREGEEEEEGFKAGEERGFRNVKLYDWQCKYMGVHRSNFELSKEETDVVGHVLQLEGLAATEKPTAGGVKPLLHAATAHDAVCAWAVDDWTDSGVFAPEMAQLRDVSFLMKMMIAEPLHLRESVSAPDAGGSASESWLTRPVVYPSSLQPSWAVTSSQKTDQAEALLCVRWGPSSEMVRLDKPRALGAGRRTLADAQQFGVRPKFERLNEDDVVHHLGALPNFDGKLADEDSERLMTYLTVPFMNIPLVLGLFNRENIGALLDTKLQCLLEWVLFETGPFTNEVNAAVEVKKVPIEYDKQDKLLATRWGRLMHELLVAPVPVLRAVRELLHLAVYISAAEYTSTYVPLVLWLSRTAARIASFAQHEDAELAEFQMGDDKDPRYVTFAVSATGGRSGSSFNKPTRFAVNGAAVKTDKEARQPSYMAYSFTANDAEDGFNFLVIDAQTLSKLAEFRVDTLPNEEKHEEAKVSFAKCALLSLQQLSSSCYSVPPPLTLSLSTHPCRSKSW